MPILADYHMHSSFSGDSRAPMQDMAARAIALGYQEICFTEHIGPALSCFRRVSRRHVFIKYRFLSL